MKFETTRTDVLKPLQLASGVIERRQTLPILQNLHIAATEDGGLSFRGTDLEVYMVGTVPNGVTVSEAGATTADARKLFSICRALPPDTALTVETEQDGTHGTMTVKSGRSRFKLATLSADDYPAFDSPGEETELTLSRGDMLQLVERVSFSMALNDVRYYLNAMLLDLSSDSIVTVATDAYRLAHFELARETPEIGDRRIQAVVPRKAVQEIMRLVSNSDENVHLAVSKDRLRVSQGDFTLSTRLVDAKYPDYANLIPPTPDNRMLANRDELMNVLNRVGILANQRYPGVNLTMKEGTLTVRASNPEQEEGEEVLAVEYEGPEMSIGFNVEFLKAILANISTEKVEIGANDSESSALLGGHGDSRATYVLVPMNL